MTDTIITLPSRDVDRHRSDAQDASAATMAAKDSRVGWVVVVLFFGGLLGFSAFVRLDAAAHAQATVTVAGNRQVVQHRDGGIVQALHVREGQHVPQGRFWWNWAGPKWLPTNGRLPPKPSTC